MGTSLRRREQTITLLRKTLNLQPKLNNLKKISLFKKELTYLRIGCLLIIFMEFVENRRAVYCDPCGKFYWTGKIQLEKRSKTAASNVWPPTNRVNSNRPKITELSYIATSFTQ